MAIPQHNPLTKNNTRKLSTRRCAYLSIRQHVLDIKVSHDEVFHHFQVVVFGCKRQRSLAILKYIANICYIQSLKVTSQWCKERVASPDKQSWRQGCNRSEKIYRNNQMIASIRETAWRITKITPYKGRRKRRKKKHVFASSQKNNVTIKAFCLKLKKMPGPFSNLASKYGKRPWLRIPAFNLRPGILKVKSEREDVCPWVNCFTDLFLARPRPKQQISLAIIWPS